MFIRGRNFRLIDSATRVKDPVIRAWEAMIAAKVARTIAARRMFSGIMA